ARGAQSHSRSRRVLHPRLERGGAGAARLRRRDGALRPADGRVSRALRGFLRPRLRPCRCRRAWRARSAGGALARSAFHPRARPDRGTARLREHADATALALRLGHWLELPGAWTQAVETFPYLIRTLGS